MRKIFRLSENFPGYPENLPKDPKTFQADLIFVTNITNIISGKNCHLEKFQLPMYDNFGEIENFSTGGEISDVAT